MEERKSDFHELFVRVYPKLLVYACRLVGENNAEDLVQDVFINFWANDYTIKDHLQAEKILFRSVYNRGLNIIRHDKITASYSEGVRQLYKARMDYYDPDRPEAIAKLEDKQLGQAIEEAINALPEKSRQAFKFSYIYGIPEKDIAAMMGISTRTVEVHIYRALRALRKKLETIIPVIISLIYL